jgi:hypothetical protein
MIGRRTVVFVLAILITACTAREVAKLPGGRTHDDFFKILAAWCARYPDANSWEACPVCNSQTCPTCAPDPVREQRVANCNPNSWDCAASVAFSPNDGGQCPYVPNGACDCPAPDGPPGRRQKSKSLRSTASLAPPAFSPARRVAASVSGEAPAE